MKTDTMEPPTTSAADVRDIPLHLCHYDPANKERPIDPAYRASIVDKGQEVIAIVRPHPELEGKFMIVDGARRHRTLLEEGGTTLRAQVREMSDQEAADTRLLANKQRAGLSWRQEVEAIEEYLEKYPSGADNLAAALGLTEGQVRRRRKLLDLSPRWLAAIKKGELPAWTIEHFELLTVYDKKQQEDIYQSHNYDAAGMSVKEFREELAGETQILKSAPWKLDDADLCPKAGACTACSKRTGIESDLFEEPDAKVKKGDRCLDAQCFQQKHDAHLALKETALKEEHPSLVKVSKISWSNHDGAIGTGSYKVAKKTEKGAVPAIVKETGALTYVKLDKERVPSQAARAAGGGKTPLKDRQAALEKRRVLLVITKLIKWTEAKDLEYAKTDFGLMVALIHVFGTDNQDTRKTTRYGWAGVKKWTKTAPTADELWPRVQGVLVDQLRSQLYRDKPSLVDAKEIAAIVSADLVAFRKEAEAEIPVPKSWAEELAGKKPKGSKPPKDVRANVDLGDDPDGFGGDHFEMDDE